MRKVFALVAVLSVLLLAVGCVVVEVGPNGSTDYKEYGEESYSGFKYLTLDNSNGSVAIEPATDGKIKVQWEKRLRGISEERLREVAPEVEIKILEDGATLRIKTVIPQPRPSGVSSMGASYRLYIPVDILAQIDTSNGSIQVQGIQQDIDLRTSNGSIRVADHVGNIVARTSNGPIDIERAEGMIKANSSNGSISLMDTAGAIDAETSNSRINVNSTRTITSADLDTSNGTIEFRGHLNREGHYELKTSNGSIHMWIEKQYGYDLTANTSNGRIRFEFPVLFNGKQENTYVNGQLFGGGIDLYLRTSNGNITVYEMGAQ